tara:strand:+ start:103 stop:1209 length:1107 start_codon:yes stop_codon:yes gene_type:complete
MTRSRIAHSNIASVPNLGRRNMIINGAMQVAQRGTSSTGVGASDGYFVCDRWNFAQATNAGRLTMTQDSSAPSGFANSLKLACTTADTSIGADEAALIQHRIEGQNLQAFAKGTSDAKPFALSFYVKGNASATYTAELFDNDNSRGNGQLFNVTTDWTRVELTFPADTTGAFDDDNAASLYFNIWLHAGSTYTGGTFTNGTWTATSNANVRVGDGTSFFDSTSRTFFITGVQLETGNVATPFEHRSFAEEFNLCKRYFQTLGYQYGDTIGATNDYNGAIDAPILSTESGYNYFGGSQYPIQMRAQPTITIYARVSGTETAGKLIDFNGGGDLGNSSVTRIRANGYGYLQSASGNNYGAVYRSVSNAEL